ncbi:MAG: hypothetical protein HQK56_01310 [Deltaproteobacteria bacterium]|nr:hypothetical protein [Deltaproteobacteria bacterium]
MTGKEYLDLELDEIQRHKWIESEKVGYDLGEKAVMDWVQFYAERFASYWRRFIEWNGSNGN